MTRRLGNTTLVVLVLVCAFPAVSLAKLSLTAARKEAGVVCAREELKDTSTSVRLSSKMAAGLVVHVFSVEVSITRDHDTALSALNGPTSFNAAIKRLVADNSRTIAAVNTLIRHFKAMPAKQDVTLGEVGRYFGPPEKASNATQLWMATSDLPMLCAYEP